MITGGLIYLLRYQPVQTYFAQKAAAYLSHELNTTVSLQGIYFKPFSSLVLSGLYVEDLQGDTLLYSQQLSARLNLGRLSMGEVAVHYIKLSGGKFSLKRDEDRTNLSFIIDYFQPEKRDAEKSTTGKITLNVDEVVLDQVSFAYHDAGSQHKLGVVNLSDIALTEVSGHFANINFTDHLFRSVIHKLQFREKSGFQLYEMNTLAIIDTNSVELQDLYAETNRSRIRHYLRLDYPDFSAFNDFVNQVEITLDLDHAQINSKDIEFFAPNVNVTNFNVALSGSITGRIPALSAENVVMQIGNNTGMAGDFTINGLPKIDQTVFDLQLTRLETNGTDIESLVPQLGNTPALHLPAIFHRMGNLRYQGSLIGHYDDFIAYGSLETDLGTADTDIHLNIRAGNQYAGKLATTDFDLGALIEKPDVGFGSFAIAIDGSGFTAADMNSEITGRINHLDFRNYGYSNIDIAGKLTEMQFAGAIGIADPNLQLQFDGEINFDPTRPAYHFSAQVDRADLRQLRLYDKTPVIIESATIASDLNGNSLNNIQGGVMVSDIRFQADTGTYTVDSVKLVAKGDEEQRVLWLASDVADATLAGEVDLYSLDTYFKSILTHYAPALGLAAAEISGKQVFSIDLNLKKFAPVAVFVVPELTLAEGTSLRGYFSTETETANFNLLVPKIQYGNLNVDRLIVDEAANGHSLRLLATADRISLTDSLYIDNVNIANTVINDSLLFNLKLAHASASNRLDLNGFVRFTENSPVEVSFQPSSVLLNEEPWQLGQQALISLDNGRIHLQDVELKNNEQTVRLEGYISTTAEDQATLIFSNFNLNTFNAATRPAGVALEGVLNGRMDISSVLKNPYFVADIEATDILYNNTEIGNLLLQANFDQNTRLVNVNMEVAHRNVRTISATGTYDAAAATDKLKLDVTLDQSELMIFQPALRNLVSDITGTVSADLQITGTILDPRINGRCRLHQAGFTVNYLNTPYRIDDEVYLSNSTILIKDLTLIDPKNSEAIANGKVDMRNPLIPDLDVVINATDFLVLNTTFRDNPLYYGTAHGTGSFVFRGATNAINIDIAARTNENTKLTIPLNAVGTVSDNDFIRFVNQDTVDANPSQPSLLKGLSMNMDFQVTPDAEISLYTDLGELSGRGEGLLSMRVSSLGDFEMFGDYAINSGKFTFTAQDFINKIFDLTPGGSIRWTGQPQEATVNLTAVYEQRTSLSPLYNAAGRETNEQRALAQAQMNLNGSIMQPEISFGLNFPNDPYVKDELQSFLSDANNVNQQALSLIVRRSFTPGSATDFSRELNNTLLSAGTELAFNQLNNIIAQSLNLNFVDLNIRSLNDASASVHLFNDRLIFTGGVTDRRNVMDLNVFSDHIATDAELQYLIRQDGRLVLRASNRLNSRNFLLNLNDNYVSAVGLVYRQEFYTFREFLQRLLTIRNKEEDKSE